MFWNIKIKTNNGEEKSINIHSEEHTNLRFIISTMIARYTNVEKFFDVAKTKYTVGHNSVYSSENICVFVMNGDAGYIDFHNNNEVRSIYISKHQLYFIKGYINYLDS